MISESALLRDIDAYLNAAPRSRCDVVESGPFDIFLNRSGRNPHMSYARPARSFSGDLASGIRAVTGVFRERGYTPRWEYVEELTPELTPALMAAGFPSPEMRPLMVQSESVALSIPSGVTIKHITDLGQLLEAASVQKRGFGIEDEEDGGSDPVKLTECGMRFFAAFVDRIIVSAGVQIPMEGVAELAGIATLAEYRRRGTGAALTAAMAADGRKDGCHAVFLSAGDNEIARIYQRAGFQTIGHAADTMKE
jgi:ribosomal protein S18 acetylase RimI-like enzyme